jgi:ABC-type molybdate transport system permease subunit
VESHEGFEDQKIIAAYCNIALQVGVLRANNKTTRMTLFEVLMPLSIFGGLGGSIYLFAKVMTDFNLKKRMIEKGYVNDDTQAIFKNISTENKYSALKWGLITLSGGLALIVMEYTGVDRESTLPYGIFATFISVGFLAYYFIVKREQK